MKNRWLVVAALVVVVALCGFTIAVVNAQEPDESEGRFDSCRIEDGQLFLTFTHGTNERVSTSADLRDDSLVVSLRREPGEGVSSMVAYLGEVNYVVGSNRTVVYPDGDPLDCLTSGSPSN